MHKLKSVFLLPLLAVWLLSLSACGTLFTKGGSDYRAGEQAYKAGDYATAAEAAISAIEKKFRF